MNKWFVMRAGESGCATNAYLAEACTRSTLSSDAHLPSFCEPIQRCKQPGEREGSARESRNAKSLPDRALHLRRHLTVALASTANQLYCTFHPSRPRLNLWTNRHTASELLDENLHSMLDSTLDSHTLPIFGM